MLPLPRAWPKIGDRVRLRPKAGGDIMDVVLRDQIAVVEAIERDFENRVHVAVTILDDPGRDLGMDRMPGHRFFFAPDEIEPASAVSGTGKAHERRPRGRDRQYLPRR